MLQKIRSNLYVHFFLFAFLIFVTWPSQAADEKSFSTALEAQPSGAYELDTKHASLHWKISHLGLSNYTARFDSLSGSLQYDAKNPLASRVEIKVDPASVNTGLADFDQKLKGEGYFDVAKFPEIKFVSTKLDMVATPDTTPKQVKGKMTGDLTFLGVTKPVTLDVTFNGGVFNKYAGAHALGFSATTTLKRSDFGLTTLLPAVGDDVTLVIEVEFLHQDPKKKQ
jgi:polyisoprenoid-binding protein YceI